MASAIARVSLPGISLDMIYDRDSHFAERACITADDTS